MMVFELDELGEPRNGLVQQELEKITGVLTVPQVFVDGEFIGGANDIDELRSTNMLKKTLQHSKTQLPPSSQGLHRV